MSDKLLPFNCRSPVILTIPETSNAVEADVLPTATFAWNMLSLANVLISSVWALDDPAIFPM